MGAPQITGATARSAKSEPLDADVRVRGITCVIATDRPAKHDQPLSPMADQPLRVTSSEGAPAAEQEDGLEQGRLPRAVAAPDQVVAGVQLELGVLYTAEVVDGEFGEAQDGAPAVRRRDARHSSSRIRAVVTLHLARAVTRT
jgi:hypothetical protein